MAVRAPDIDGRSAADIAAQVKDLLAVYAPEWKEFDPHTGKPDSMSAALINIFARYCEIIIQRLNQVPEKNFLAFLDLLGASPRPPQPARVPLTFTVAAGCADAAVVRAGTQVAAPPVEGEKDPVIFETEREFTATSVRLAAVFTRDPEFDRFADHGDALRTAGGAGTAVFEGDRRIEHVFYLGQEALLGLENVKKLIISCTTASAVDHAEPRELDWEFWDGDAWRQKTPVNDGTNQLTKTGDVEFSDLAPVPAGEVQGRRSRWLRCRLLTPMTPGPEKRKNWVRGTSIPPLIGIGMTVELEQADHEAQSAYHNTAVLDTSKEFLPFGEKPKFGDAMYLENRDAFSQPGTRITLRVTLTNPVDAEEPPVPATQPSSNLAVSWECWTGTSWALLGVGKAGSVKAGSVVEQPGFTDRTRAFTMSGEVLLTLPVAPAARVVNGVEGFWIRARITSGDYGTETKYIKDETQPAGFRVELATFAPPMIGSVAIDYSVTTPEQRPDAIIRYNDFVYDPVASLVGGTDPAVAPFAVSEDRRPSIYYGFVLPSGLTAFPNRPVSLFNGVTEYRYGETPPSAPDESAREQPEVSWEYWNGQVWTGIAVRDESERFTRPGVVEFLPPADFRERNEFGVSAFWVRARWVGGGYALAPRLNRVLLNTVMASQSVTVRNEVLGSSDQSESQKFRTGRRPVLEGQVLMVREPEMPSPEEQEDIGRDEDEEAVERTAAGKIWVRWREAPDFYGSGPRDRHYVIDRRCGEITFGDGVNGRIPPRGSGNIRMARYRTGGGSRGNRPAGAVAQLKTTIPYVEKVTNTGPSRGGADAETPESLYESAPRSVRHRGRAVTGEDYEDLARLASAEVARALCVPFRNLLDDPFGDRDRLGQVSVIIVPQSAEAKPLPGLELMTRVRSYVQERGAPTANLSVVGALFVRVDVTADIALRSLEGAGAVEEAVRSRLAEFLHPLTGGAANRGWDFGRKPYPSDLYGLIEAVPGVDHIRSLALAEVEEPAGAKQTGRFLVYSGSHRITMVFEG